MAQKLYIDDHKIFDETPFIDSDCLFFKHPDMVWECCAQADFAMRGWQFLTGHSEPERNGLVYPLVEDLQALLRKSSIARFPHFNSGVFFFLRGPVAAQVFDTARHIYTEKDDLGFRSFKGAPVGDEPVFAVAMEKCGVKIRVARRPRSACSTIPASTS